MSDDYTKVYDSVHNYYDDCCQDFLKIAAMKNLSPIYNQNWETDGDLLNCLTFMKEYIESQNLPNIENLQIFQKSGVTPALFFLAKNPNLKENYTILFISHIDKIPFGTGWTRCQPDRPVISDGCLYGRGTSISLYAIFNIIGVLKACEENKKERPHIAVLIESSYESGSKDLIANLENASSLMGEINQVFCLDTWGPTKENFHYMKSCRGYISFDLKITTGLENVHSGFYGGIIPDPIMIFNNILSNKIETIEKSEDELATNIKIPLLEYEATEEEKAEGKSLVGACGFKIVNMFPYFGCSDLIGSKNQVKEDDYLTAYINGVLRPSLSIIGFEEMPTIENASGSIKPNICARLCFRTPPILDTTEGFSKLKELITSNPPFGAKIEILNEDICPGVDLVKTNNCITKAMVDSFDKYYQKMKRKITLPVRMGRSCPCLYYLTQKFKNIPIFASGCGNTFSDNVRDGNENINLIKLINYTVSMTYYVCDFRNYMK